MLTIGFEIEAFCQRDGVPILVPSGLPYDECGWLAEVRSEPHHDVRNAIYLLMAAKETVRLNAFGKCDLIYTPLMEIPRALKVQAARKHGKGLLRYENIYGHETHRNATKLATASLHISFKDEQKWHYTDEKGKAQIHTYAGFVDHAKYIVGLDRAFKAEIAAAKRNPGFYEVKGDGRIEYRSLPNDVSLDKLTEVLLELRK